MQRNYFKNIKRRAFTLVELIIVIAIITLLAGIVVVTINPASIFAGSRNGQRSNDLSTIQTAINRYLGDSPITGSTRSLADFTGYTNLLSDAIVSTNGRCASGVNGISSSTTITGSYDLNTTGTNFINLSLLQNNNYLPKIPKDPQTGNPYQACIDTTNNNQLVIFASNSEGSGNKAGNFFPALWEGTSTNIVNNPSLENNSNVGESFCQNATCAVSTEKSYSGTYSMKVTSSSSSSVLIGQQNAAEYLTVSPNTIYTASFYIYSLNKAITSLVYLIEFTSANGYITESAGSNFSVPANAWTRVTRTFTTGSTTGKVSIRPMGQTTATGDIVYFDAIQLEQRPAASSYIDGTLGSNYGWNGTANASSSYRIK